jgi:hypothetical protein
MRIRRRVLLTVALTLGAAAVAVGSAAAGGSPNAVTITAFEPFFPPNSSTFVASGGIFATTTAGAFHSDFDVQGPVGESPISISRGTDTLTSALGTITWDFVAVCRPATTFFGLVCDGSWHVTSPGLHGGGTLHGELNFQTFFGSDTFTGNIVASP